VPPVELKLAEGTNEILVTGPTLFQGYWRDPEATAAVVRDGWYHTGDVGRFDEHGNLVLSGRTRNVIVLPNGLNVFPEDIENVLNDVGLAQAVVLETAPGRIEAVVLSPDAPPVVTPTAASPPPPANEAEMAVLRQRIDGLVKQANSRLGQAQRINDWRLWPEADFPRTHTLKIKRGDVHRWAAADAAIPLHDPTEG